MTAKEYLQNAYKIERRVKIIENKVKKTAVTKFRFSEGN